MVLSLKELSTLLDSEIYYTKDGSLPSSESTPYEGPIELYTSEELKAVPIRAIAYYKGGETSEVYTKTYFMGNQEEERFSTRIVSIVGDPEDFSGEEEPYLYHKAVYGEEIEKIKEFFRLRPEVMREDLKRLSFPLCE